MTIKLITCFVFLNLVLIFFFEKFKKIIIKTKFDISISKKIIILITFLSLIFVLSSCSDDTDNPLVTNDNIIGLWELETLIIDGSVVDYIDRETAVEQLHVNFDEKIRVFQIREVIPESMYDSRSEADHHLTVFFLVVYINIMPFKVNAFEIGFDGDGCLECVWQLPSVFSAQAGGAVGNIGINRQAGERFEQDCGGIAFGCGTAAQYFGTGYYRDVSLAILKPFEPFRGFPAAAQMVDQANNVNGQPGGNGLANGTSVTPDQLKARILILKDISRFQELIDNYKDNDKLDEAQFEIAETVLKKLGNRVKAIQEFRKVVSEHAKSYKADDAQFMVGSLLLEMARFGEARSELLLVVKQYPDSPFSDDALFHHAWSFEREAELEEGLTSEERVRRVIEKGQKVRFLERARKK